jgi:tetratricopeptide (TPR) repeat protein
MKLTKAVLILCCLFCLAHQPAQGATVRAVKGVVITPDGTLVPKFSVVIRHESDKPELVRRTHFTRGEFAIDGLTPGKYQLQINSAQFVSTKLSVDLTSHSRLTDYSIVILYPYRNEPRLTPGRAYTVSAKVLQQRIPGTAREAYMHGVELHREGQLDAALVQYGKALRGYPKYLEALTDIGSILLLYNRPLAALTFLRRAKEVDPRNPIINMNIAVALAEQGDFGGATKLLKNVLDNDPRLAQAHYLAGKIQFLQKKYVQAETYIRQALYNDPNLLDAWLLIADISLRQQRLDDARDALQHVREAVSNQMVTEFIDEQLSALGS